MRKQTAQVPPHLEGPLDRAVRDLFGLSWGKARASIESGKVQVGDETVTTATERVGAGRTLTLNEQAPRPRRRELGDDAIVFADAQVIVVAKPAGISTIPYEGDERGGPGPTRPTRPTRPTPAVDAAGGDTLDGRVRDWLSRRGLAPRGSRPSLGVVHRLDKDTSGLIVFTRTWVAKQKLTAQFRQHTVHRRYLAIAHGDVRAATIRSILVQNRGDGLRGSLRHSTRGGRPADAREAITHVTPVEALMAATLVACRLETGRTHQIRIHLSEGGHPLAGERVYVRGFAGPLIDAPRLMLHAAELGFVHPTTEKEVRWESPLPADMEGVVEHLRGRSA